MYLNSFLELPQEDGIMYATTLFRGTSSTWWQYTQPAFQGNWDDFKTIVRESWQQVNPQRASRDKIANLLQVGSMADLQASLWSYRHVYLPCLKKKQ